MNFYNSIARKLSNWKMGKESEWTFFQKRHKWPEPWKHAQHHSSSGKCKLKPQWDFTLDLSEWALGEKTRKKKNISKDVEKRVCTVSGNVNLCSCYRKQYGGFSKNLKWDYHVIEQSQSCVFIQRKRKH